MLRPRPRCRLRTQTLPATRACCFTSRAAAPNPRVFLDISIGDGEPQRITFEARPLHIWQAVSRAVTLPFVCCAALHTDCAAGCRPVPSLAPPHTHPTSLHLLTRTRARFCVCFTKPRCAATRKLSRVVYWCAQRLFHGQRALRYAAAALRRKGHRHRERQTAALQGLGILPDHPRVHVPGRRHHV